MYFLNFDVKLLQGTIFLKPSLDHTAVSTGHMMSRIPCMMVREHKQRVQ